MPSTWSSIIIIIASVEEGGGGSGGAPTTPTPGTRPGGGSAACIVRPRSLGRGLLLAAGWLNWVNLEIDGTEIVPVIWPVVGFGGNGGSEYRWIDRGSLSYGHANHRKARRSSSYPSSTSTRSQRGGGSQEDIRVRPDEEGIPIQPFLAGVAPHSIAGRNQSTKQSGHRGAVSLIQLLLETGFEKFHLQQKGRRRVSPTTRRRRCLSTGLETD